VDIASQEVVKRGRTSAGTSRLLGQHILGRDALQNDVPLLKAGINSCIDEL